MGFVIFTGCGAEGEKPEIPASSEAENTSEGTDSPEAEKALEEDNETTAAVTVQVTADEGWNQNSTPAIVHIVSKNKTGKLDFYHAVSPEEEGKKGTSAMELAEGAYTLEWISPINEDGSVYEIEQNPQEITIRADSEGKAGMECFMKRIPAEEAPEEMVQELVNKIKTAVEKGDKTLSGEIGTAILETLDRNRKNRPEDANRAEESQEETAGKQEETTEKQEGITEEQGKGNGNRGDQDSSREAGKDGSEGNEPSGSTEPSHEHSWQEHTATREEWVPDMVVVDDYEIQEVEVGYAIQCNCGAVLTEEELESHGANHILNGEPANHWTIPITEPRQVKVGSHEEDHGHYETVTYVDYYYCDCGATK